MTAAERYRQLEISPSVQVARWIFNNRLNNAPTIPLREVVEDIKTGKTPSKNEKKYYENGVLDWFKPSEIGEGKYLTDAKDKLSQLAVDTKQATIYQAGTLLITAIGDIGRLAITTDVASSNQQITGIAFNKQVLPEYAYYYFLAFRAFFYTDVSQTTLPIVNQKKITSIPFILCSVKEQKATTDFLSAIELIKLPQDVEQLDSLTSDNELLEVARGIFAIHFASATLVAEFNKQELHLTQLRQALMREAMQGRLLPQDPTDEPAAALLQQLQATKAAVGKAGKRPAAPLFAEEAEAVEGPFAIPGSWVWCTLEDLATLITDGTHQTPSYTEQGRPFLSAQNIKPFRFMPEVHRYVSEEAYQEYIKIKKPELGDLLIARVGAGIGECAVIDKEVDFAFYVSLGLVKLVPGFLSPDYLAYMINGPFGVAYSKNNIASKGGSAGNFNLTKIRTFPIPLPPLAEQQRIVAKLGQLLGHCDALEQRIAESRRLAGQLLQTALREALAGPGGAVA